MEKNHLKSRFMRRPVRRSKRGNVFIVGSQLTL